MNDWSISKTEYNLMTKQYILIRGRASTEVEIEWFLFLIQLM